MFQFGWIGSNFNAISMEPLGHIAGSASSVQGFLQTLGGGVIGAAIGQMFDGTTTPLAAGFAGVAAVGLGMVLIAERGVLFRSQHDAKPAGRLDSQPPSPRQRREVEQLSVEQMRRPHIGQRADHRVLAARHAPLDVVEHRFHGVALQPFLAAAEVAGDDRELHRLGELLEVGFGAEAERPQHHDVALVVESFGGIAASLPPWKRFMKKVSRMSSRWCPSTSARAAFLARDAVEMPAPQPRAERAIGAALGNLVGHHRIGVLVFDAVLDAVTAEEIRQHVLREVRLALVEVAGEQIDRQQAAPFEVEQHGEQPVGILAARQRHQPAIAGAAPWRKSSIAWRVGRSSRLRSLPNSTEEGASRNSEKSPACGSAASTSRVWIPILPSNASDRATPA